MHKPTKTGKKMRIFKRPREPVGGKTMQGVDKTVTVQAGSVNKTLLHTDHAEGQVSTGSQNRTETGVLIPFEETTQELEMKNAIGTHGTDSEGEHNQPPEKRSAEETKYTGQDNVKMME